MRMLVWHDEQSLAAYAFGTVEQGSFHICITTGRCGVWANDEGQILGDLLAPYLTLPVDKSQRLARFERSSCQLTLRQHLLQILTGKRPDFSNRPRSVMRYSSSGHALTML